MLFTEMMAILKDVEYKDWSFHIRIDGDRPYLQVRFQDECAFGGGMIEQCCRKWFLSPHMSKSELVMTAMKAVLTEEEINECL